MTRKPDHQRRILILAAAGLASLTASRGLSAAGIEAGPNGGHAAFIERAFELQDQASRHGDQAYGAVVVRNGVIVGQAASLVLRKQDPTAHAEMEAIRDAARRLETRDLSGCLLYSSSQACPMCEAAAYWAGIEGMISGRAARDHGRPRLCG